MDQTTTELVGKLLELTGRHDGHRVLTLFKRCQFCDRPLLDAKVFTDRDTCDSGLGVELCGRLDCIEERAATPLTVRLHVYLATQSHDWRR